jgi:hypothetical protein
MTEGESAVKWRTITLGAVLLLPSVPSTSSQQQSTSSSQQQSTSESLRRRTPQKVSAEASAQRSALQDLSIFVHALASGAPELAASVWSSEPSAGGRPTVNSLKPEDLASFVVNMDLDGPPPLRVVRPRVTRRGDRVIVACFCMWDIRFRDGTQFRWSGHDEFVFLQEGATLRLESARWAPLVVRHSHEAQQFGAFSSRMSADMDRE